MMKNCLLILALLAGTVPSLAQVNFVPNNSFEEHYRPCDRDGADCAKSWYEPTNAGGDYFNDKTKEFKPLDKSNVAQDGHGFAGLYTMNGEEREYLAIHLNFTLRELNIYEFSVWTRYVADSSSTATPLQLVVKNKPFLDLPQKTVIDHATNASTIPQKSGDWTLTKMTFTAEGGEKYLTIGYFDDPATKTGTCYYYVDNITLKKIGVAEKEEEVAEEVEDLDARGISIDEEGTDAGETITLQSIQFERASSILTISSYKELDELAVRLSAMKNYKVEIYGHTDNTGTKSRNKELSEDRAKAVATYLIDKGIPNSNVSWKGFGAERPKASNDTPEGRRTNRRVECRITQ